MAGTTWRLPVTKIASVNVTLVAMDCANCGVVFGMTDEMIERRRFDGAKFYCPNGHNLHFNGEEERLKRQRDEAQRALARTQDMYNAEKRSHAATKGQLTKAKHRAARGLCPYCNVEFGNVRDHVREEHPEEER